MDYDVWKLKIKVTADEIGADPLSPIKKKAYFRWPMLLLGCAMELCGTGTSSSNGICVSYVYIWRYTHAPEFQRTA